MKTRINFIYALILFSFINVNTNAQIFLRLDKGGYKKKRYFVGDDITFKTQDSKKFIKGIIENIGDSITISGENYAVNQFHKIQVTSSSALAPLLISGSKVLPQAAVLYLLSVSVSSKLHEDYPLIETKHLKVTAGLLIGAFIMYKLSYHTYTVGDRHQLKVFNLNNPNLQN